MSNDAHLKDSVLAELQWTPTVNAAHIGVAAHDGVITLTGHVETYAEKHAAEVAVRSVKGVRAIAEEIEVKLAFDVKRSDEEIAAAVLMRMAWDFIGSEFAGRHQQYEKFYGGASFLVKQNMLRNYDIAGATALVDAALALPAFCSNNPSCAGMHRAGYHRGAVPPGKTCGRC